MTIRTGTPADVPVVRELVEELVQELPRPFPVPPWEDAWLDDKLVLISEEPGGVCGTACGTVAAPIAHLHIVYVRPDNRGRGIGTALVREFVTRCRAAGVEHLTLDVDTGNTPARALWSRLGFEEYALRLSTPVASLDARLQEAP